MMGAWTLPRISLIVGSRIMTAPSGTNKVSVCCVYSLQYTFCLDKLLLLWNIHTTIAIIVALEGFFLLQKEQNHAAASPTV